MALTGSLSVKRPLSGHVQIVCKLRPTNDKSDDLIGGRKSGMQTRGRFGVVRHFCSDLCSMLALFS